MNTPREIPNGTTVRSYDFPPMGETNPDLCKIGWEKFYVEGVVEGTTREGFDCPRYRVRVTKVVWNARAEAPDPRRPFVYPPLNGTLTSMGRVTDGVEVVA